MCSRHSLFIRPPLNVNWHQNSQLPSYIVRATDATTTTVRIWTGPYTLNDNSIIILRVKCVHAQKPVLYLLHYYYYSYCREAARSRTAQICEHYYFRARIQVGAMPPIYFTPTKFICSQQARPNNNTTQHSITFFVEFVPRALARCLSLFCGAAC